MLQENLQYIQLISGVPNQRDKHLHHGNVSRVEQFLKSHCFQTKFANSKEMVSLFLLRFRKKQTYYLIELNVFHPEVLSNTRRY